MRLCLLWPCTPWSQPAGGGGGCFVGSDGDSSGGKGFPALAVGANSATVFFLCEMCRDAVVMRCRVRVCLHVRAAFSLPQAMLTALGKDVHEGVSAVHIRIASLAEVTAEAAEEKVCLLSPDAAPRAVVTSVIGFPPRRSICTMTGAPFGCMGPTFFSC
jgi:hypothetical protein